MAVRTKKKSRESASSTRKKSPARKAVKKTVKKKAVKKKRLVGKKTARKKSAVRKAVKKKTARKKTATVSKIPKQTISIEPGPPSLSVPPVEEPASTEEAIGTVTHYYSHLGVAVVQVNKGAIQTGDTIRIKGHTTDFMQTIDSMEYEHQHTDQASAGQSVGLKVADHVREHDILYRIK